MLGAGGKEEEEKDFILTADSWQIPTSAQAGPGQSWELSHSQSPVWGRNSSTWASICGLPGI